MSTSVRPTARCNLSLYTTRAPHMLAARAAQMWWLRDNHFVRFFVFPKTETFHPHIMQSYQTQILQHLAQPVYEQPLSQTLSDQQVCSFGRPTEQSPLTDYEFKGFMTSDCDSANSTPEEEVEVFAPELLARYTTTPCASEN